MSKQGEYVKNEEILETAWKCSTCGQENRGKDMKCGGCQAPKDESSKYELKADGAAVTDEKQLADAAAGLHWICAFCEKENRGTKTICAFCNADQTKRDRKPTDAPAPAPAPKSGGIPVGVLVAIVAVIGLVVWLLMPRHVEAKVSEISWQQIVLLRTQTVVNKDGWRDQVPGDAFNRDCFEKQRGTKPVKVGEHEECREETKDLGNGYAKKQQVCKMVDDTEDRPVYDDFCTYSIHEWPVTRTAQRNGASASGYAWPDDAEVLAGAAPACAPCVNDKGPAGTTVCCAREAHYRVTFDDPEKPGKHPVLEVAGADDLAKYSIGQGVKLKVRGETAELDDAK